MPGPGVKRTPRSSAPGRVTDDHAAVSGPAMNTPPSPTTRSRQPSGTIRFGPAEADRHTQRATPASGAGGAVSSYTPRSCTRGPTKLRLVGAPDWVKVGHLAKSRLTRREVTARYRRRTRRKCARREKTSPWVFPPRPAQPRLPGPRQVGRQRRGRPGGARRGLRGDGVRRAPVHARTGQGRSRWPRPVVPAAVATASHSVVYELLGAHGARDVTYAAAGSVLTQHAEVTTPWSAEFTRVGPAGRTEFYSIAARNPGPGDAALPDRRRRRRRRREDRRRAGPPVQLRRLTPTMGGVNDAAITFGPALVAVLVLLAVAGTAVVQAGGLGRGRAVLIAAARAVAQLAAVSLVITAVLRSAPLTGLFVLLMFGIAAVTSARRAGTWANLPVDGAGHRRRRRAGARAGPRRRGGPAEADRGRADRRHRHRRRDDRDVAGRPPGARRAEGPPRRVRSRARAGVPAAPGRAGDLPPVAPGTR